MIRFPTERTRTFGRVRSVNGNVIYLDDLQRIVFWDGETRRVSRVETSSQ